jgi:hypothetical protein
MKTLENYHGVFCIKVNIELPYGGNCELTGIHQWSRNFVWTSNGQSVYLTNFCGPCDTL